MALLTHKAVADYEAQKSAFEDFLRNFKSSTAETEDALDDLHLNGDRDEYDFMDDAQGGGDGARARRIAGRSKAKYMNLLQDVSERTESQVLINLDDLNEYERSLEQEGVDPLNLVESIERNANHYVEVFSRAVDTVMPAPITEPNFKDDVLDIILTQRSKRNEAVRQQMEH
ncbi:hypothetical protein KC343_g17543, partial [Hortaea werneckii]